MHNHTLHEERLPEGEIIFRGFPIEQTAYQPDVAAIAPETLARYGVREWRAAVLTGELHGHLGVYAILGVKMGIYALELFGTPRYGLELTSYAGSHPPISCLNDGLQVATGATLGHGNIRIASQSKAVPKVLFSEGERCHTLALKASFQAQIAHDIQQGKERFGNRTNAYWEHIRQCALHYWATWDRHEIFTSNGCE